GPGRGRKFSRGYLARRAVGFRSLTSATGPTEGVVMSLQELPTARVLEPVHPFGDFHSLTPSREELLERWRQNFDPAHAPKSSPARELKVDLPLTAEQAASGEAVAIELPVAVVCTRCDGTGSTGYYLCDQCDGHGLQWRTARVDVLLPRPTRDGTVISTSLKSVGVRNLYLCVRACVASDG